MSKKSKTIIIYAAYLVSIIAFIAGVTMINFTAIEAYHNYLHRITP